MGSCLGVDHGWLCCYVGNGRPDPQCSGGLYARYETWPGVRLGLDHGWVCCLVGNGRPDPQ